MPGNRLDTAAVPADVGAHPARVAPYTSLSREGHMSTSRRDFLKLGAAGAVGASVTAAWRPGRAEAKPAQITFIRESSYVKEFDEHFKNVLIPRYQQETGIKLNYEIVAAGGSAVPRNISIVESKAPVDAGWLQQEWLFRE